MVTRVLPKFSAHFCCGITISFLMLAACANRPNPIPKSTDRSAFAKPNNIISEELFAEEGLEDLRHDPVPSTLATQSSPTSEETQGLEIPSLTDIYPELIYGAPKPLVCSKEVFSKDTLRDRPNLQIMWEHYLYDSPKGVWAEVGGAVEVNGCLPEDKGRWRNACTVRLSHMLNKAGHKIPYWKGKTVSGGNGDQYFFRLDDAQAYLEKTFGEPDLDIADASGRFIEMPTEPGLLVIKYPGSGFTGHTTIWNGAGTVDGVNVVGSRIIFWKLPCFIPMDRKTN